MKLMLILALIICLMNWTNSQTCLKSNGTECISCIENMHLYQGNCVNDIANCKTYLNGIDCTECKPGYRLETHNICIANSSTIESEYNSFQYIELSIMEALTDINYIIGINQITSEIKELHDETPTKILAQEGHETMKLLNVRYVIDFEVLNKDKVKVSYQVLMKVNSLDGRVVVDSFRQKEPTTTIGKEETLESANTTKSPATVSETELIKKSNYINIGVDTSKGDLYLLIFLDNVNKTIEKALQQLGVKSTKNEIVFIGRLESNDFVYYWIEVEILMVDNLVRVLRVRGVENKVTYEVKVIELVEDKSVEIGSSNTNSNTNNSSNNTNTNTNTNTNPTFSNSSNNNNMNNNNTTTVTTENKGTTNTSSSNTTNTTTTSLIKNTTIVQVKDNKDIIGSSNQSNVSSTNTTSNVTPSSNNTTTSNNTTLSNITQTYTSPIYQQLNQTLLTKASGFEEINSNLFNKDEPLILVTEKFLSSRPNRSTIKLYKAFTKNYALKAEYKMFFIDETIESPNIIVYEGFATYDFLKKRVFVVSFGQMLY